MISCSNTCKRLPEKAYIPTNTSNGFKQSEFLVNKIFDSTP